MARLNCSVNSWILQMIKQWIPDCWSRSSNKKCTGPKGDTANSRNWQLMTSGRLQMLAIRNFEDWHAVVAARCRRQRWTVTASLYCTRRGIKQIASAALDVQFIHIQSQHYWAWFTDITTISLTIAQVADVAGKAACQWYTQILWYQVTSSHMYMYT